MSESMESIPILIKVRTVTPQARISISELSFGGLVLSALVCLDQRQGPASSYGSLGDQLLTVLSASSQGVSL